MADNLKKFSNYTEYLSYIQTTRDYPNVAFIRDSNEVIMNPLTTAGQKTVIDIDPLALAISSFSASDLITRLIVPSSYTEVQQYCCYNCRRLTNLVLPNSITTVGNYAFYNCISLDQLEATGVQTIAQYAFYNCSSLQVINLPAVRTINQCAFAFGRNIQRVTLGINTRSIGTYAFYNPGAQAQLTNMTITCKATTPPTITASSFPPTQYITAIKVPSESVDAYKAATNWAQYADKITAITQ